MRINGTLIGKLGGHTANSPALVDRVAEFYVTKTKLKIYLFNSGTMYWHNPTRVIQVIDVKIKTDISTLIWGYVKMLQDINNITFNDSFTHNGVKYWYRNGAEVHEVTNGCMLKYSEGVTFYEGDTGVNGNYYKDLNAWENGVGVIYIGECELNDLDSDFEAFGKYDTSNLWTKDSWVAWVKEHITNNYQDEECYQEMIECTDFIESLAYDCLYNADWLDLSTLLNDYDYNEDWVLDNWNDWKRQ